MSSSSERDQVRLKLAERYYDALQAADLESIYREDHHSGIFLAAPHEAYFSGGMKVLIVGQETREWRSKVCEAKRRQTISLNGVLAWMDNTVCFNLKKPRTSRFRQFYKSTSKRLCTESSDPSNAAVWSNQFCISYKGSNSVKSPKIEIIKDLSFRILRAQFEILKPEIAIFTVGHSRDCYLKKCFPMYKTVEIHEPNRLWEFMVDDVRCFRTNHPTWGGSYPFLRAAVERASGNV